jgi:mannose-6-phosphate isomerase
VEPILLPPNQLERFYRGGARIAALRGTDASGEYSPEEWIGSTTAAWGSETLGVSVLADGTPLPDAIAGAPEEWLGRGHVDRFGPDPCLLVKLLDAGERLPVHLHPDREFARRYLASPFGKTEAWFIAEADPGAVVHVGFKQDVDDATLRSWVEDQDVEGMLEALHELPVVRGDTLFVPAGTPHAIGAGLLIVELQEPTDFSILLEWEGFAIDGRNEGHLDLGFEVALEAVDRTGWDRQRLSQLSSPRPGAERRSGVEALFPAQADAFFRAERIKPAPSSLEPGFAILVVTEGTCELEHRDGELPLAPGAAVLVPFAAGDCGLRGAAEVLRCMPPSQPLSA